MARLNTYVHVVELTDEDGAVGRSGTFGPDDELPDWAIRAISNTKVWADRPDEDAGAGGDRPRGNASRETWAGYATSRAVPVADEMSRDEIIAAVDAVTG